MERRNIKISDKILESARRSFESYENYYQILKLDRKNLDDEKVEKAYLDKCESIEHFFRGCKEDTDKRILELKEMMLISAKDAYSALKTEQGRINYKELLEEIERKVKEEKITEREERRKEAQKKGDSEWQK